MTTYRYFLTYPANLGPISANELMRKLLTPGEWCHFLRTEKQILVNNHYLPPNLLIKASDRISIYLDHIESGQQTYPAGGKLPKVVCGDSNILVIDKPTGQKTHPNLNEKNTALDDCATHLDYSPFIVHRLGMLIDGLLLVAKNPAVVPILNRQLTNKTLHREYLAWVSRSNRLKQSGTISLSIGHDPDGQRERMVCLNNQKTITHCEVIKECRNKELVKPTLKTGHTHRIKAHLAALGVPIVGDPLCNPNYQNGGKLQLAAYQLTFMGPFKFESKTVKLIEK